jgi:hypothetical protein
VVAVTEATYEERLKAFEARLEARLAAVEADNRRLARERDEYKKLAGLLQEQVERLKRGHCQLGARRRRDRDA